MHQRRWGLKMKNNIKKIETGFEFGDVSIKFDHAVTIENKNKSSAQEYAN
jgi:hypothetical protein